jgi:hypothetical protein
LGNRHGIAVTFDSALNTSDSVVRTFLGSFPQPSTYDIYSIVAQEEATECAELFGSGLELAEIAVFVDWPANNRIS